ncbi:MAG: hypothetical protein P8L66_14340 [Rhodospirillaceae bacterium]|nr:hypothetical protein [Rhodospirillaceae bacterium]
MLEFPADVIKNEGGEYTARLVDIPDGPAGQGIDPYAALSDLSDAAQPELLKLYNNGTLPRPSAANDRPVVVFDRNASKDTGSHAMNTHFFAGTGLKNKMLGYSWTNDVIFQESGDGLSDE